MLLTLSLILPPLTTAWGCLWVNMSEDQDVSHRASRPVVGTNKSSTTRIAWATFWATVIGLGLTAVQATTGIVALDPSSPTQPTVTTTVTVTVTVAQHFPFHDWA